MRHSQFGKNIFLAFLCNRCSCDDSERAGRWIKCQLGTLSREARSANRPEYWHAGCALGHHPHRWGRVAEGGLESRGLFTRNFRLIGTPAFLDIFVDFYQELETTKLWFRSNREDHPHVFRGQVARKKSPLYMQGTLGHFEVRPLPCVQRSL